MDLSALAPLFSQYGAGGALILLVAGILAKYAHTKGWIKIPIKLPEPNLNDPALKDNSLLGLLKKAKESDDISKLPADILMKLKADIDQLLAIKIQDHQAELDKNAELVEKLKELVAKPKE